jgi:ABC-type bacteriocin/lantibiotic exporter with double-glycine peptidase domain
VGSFAKIGKHLEGFYDVMASMDKLGHLLDMPLERIDGIDLPRTKSGILVRIHNGPHASDTINESAEFAAITIEPGQKWAIVAECIGARAELLDGFAGYQTSIYGQVEVDGHDIRRLRLDSLRAQVVLLRDIEVFAGTIAENLHMGRSEVSESDMRNSLQSIGLLDDMLNLPDGLTSMVQTNGAPFCSDQLVQLMIARGMAGHPRLLIIDGLLDKLTDQTLEKVLPGLLAPGYDLTVIIGSGRQDVLAYFKRQLNLSIDGTLSISSASLPKAK